MQKSKGLARRNWSIGLGILVLICGLFLVGCGQDEPEGATVIDKPKLIFGDVSWDSVQVHNRIAGFIVSHGYGYPVDYMFGDSLPLLEGLGKGNIDILMETWVDNFKEPYTKLINEGKIKDLGSNFADAPQGWYVPTYMIKGDPERGIEPMAPDLKSVDDLPKYWELFKDPEEPDKGRFHNSPPGWLCTEHNEIKIKTYGLDKYYNVFSTGSDTALVTSMTSAYEKGEPWFGYYWEPTWVMGVLDMTLLEEPPYDEEQWNADRGCAYKPAKVTICVNSELENVAPEVIDFLKNYNTTLEQNNSFLAYMRENEGDTEAAAIWFLKQYPEVWKSWIPADIANKVEKALNEK